MKRRSLFALGLLALGRSPATATPSALEAARIQRLLQYVEAQRQVKFIRNGTAYSSQEAAQFLRAKLDKMGEHVATAAQFIDQIASRSSTSGEAYLIRFADGRTVPAAQFLGDELKRIDKQP